MDRWHAVVNALMNLGFWRHGVGYLSALFSFDAATEYLSDDLGA
jgi:hypothetical protein